MNRSTPDDDPKAGRATTIAYLDNNATTAPLPDVLNAMMDAAGRLWANPSSVHRPGQAARAAIEQARATTAALIGAEPRHLILTSGGTESNNLALAGLLEPAAGSSPENRRRAALITTGVEHSAIREPANRLARHGVELTLLAVDTCGRVSIETVMNAARRALAMTEGHPTTVLISVIAANNETGVLQPIADIGAAVAQLNAEPAVRKSRSRVYVHTDATQLVGKRSVSVDELGVDLLTFSAHKFHGPRGVGGLYVRRGVRLAPRQLGGAQETDRRGGTENTPAIVGCGVAAESAKGFINDAAAHQRIAAQRDRFETAVLETVPGSLVNAQEADRLEHTSSVAFPGLEAEAILLGLSERGVCASAGAACSSGSLDPSPVLLAMGIPEPVAHGTVRFSLSRLTTDTEIAHALRVIPEVIERLGRVLPI